MAAVDLGDRSELIDLVYGPPKEASVSAANSTTTLNNQQAVVKDNGRNERIERTEKVRVVKEKKKSSKIACSCCTIFCLVLLAAAAILLSGFCAYWFTKQDYESRLAIASYTPLERRNMSVVEDAPPLDIEEPEKETPFPSLEELRLPDNIKPLGYNVTLKIPLTSNSTIEGNSQIKLSVLEETNKIVFNGKNLVLPAPTKFRILSERKMIRKREMENSVNTTMESSAEETEDAEEATTEASNTQEFIQEVKYEKPVETLVPAGPKVVTAELNDILEKVTVTLDKPLSPGDYYLQFPFESKPSKSPLGPFVTSYKNADGSEATGFSLIGGLRKLFPSFDEKRFEAPLKLSVIHPKDSVVLSNGQDTTSEESEPGWVETIIEKPSADNTALNVFAFDKKEEEAKNGHQIRVWARPDSLNSTEFTLEQAVKIANILQDFYATTLPTETLNIVAVPGLLTGLSVPGQIQLPETAVLYDSTVDDVIDKVRIVQALSRQINKQFIGDVVPETDSSSKWVEDAMAHFVEKNALDAFFGSPDAANQQILVNSVEKSLSLDSQSSSHPLTADRETLHELTSINDVVSKEKGAAVLRMVQSIMGRDAFRQGIRNYFKKTEKGVSNYDELWNSLQESVPKDLKSWDDSDFNVADFANKWVKQMGYPVVDLYRLDPQTTELTQRRFKLDRLTPELSKFRNAVYWYKWDVPLNYWVNGDVKDMKWLHEAVRMPLNISDEILINGNAEGYYRVNYDQEGWNDIAKIFNNEHGLLSAPVRARILSDVFALAAANDLPYKIAFNVTEYLPHEDSYAPLAVALDGLLDIYERLDDSEEAVKAKTYILEKIENQFEALPEFSTLTSQEKEDFLRIKRDVSVIKAYCRLNHGKCRKQLADLAEENLLKSCEKSNFTCQCSTVPSALRYLVYCDSVAYGDDDIFEKFLNFARNEPVATERRRLVKALGCSRDPLAIRRLLKNSLSNETKLAQHDIPVFLRSLSSSDVGSLVVSDFLLDNWKDLRERLSDDVYTLSTALTNGLRPSNKRQVKLLEAFAQEHPGAKTYGSFRNQLEKGRSNLEWQRKNSDELAKLFKEL